MQTPSPEDKRIAAAYELGRRTAAIDLAVMIGSMANSAARNADVSAYDLGLANGLVLASQACRSEDFKPLMAPRVWRSDKSLRGAYQRQRKDFLRGPLVAGVAALIAWGLS